MPWNLFLFPLIGGFQFLHICQLYRFRSSRFESERLLLHSASVGMLLLFFARIFTVTAKHFAWGMWAKWALDQAIPNKDVPYLGTALTALFLGWTISHVINYLIALFGTKGAKLAISRRYDNGLRSLLVDAMFNALPVSITLDTRKVYVGYVDDMTESPHDQHFRLILLLSGYRHPDSLKFIPETSYVDQMKEEDETAFRIVLSLQRTVSANLFDLTVYEDRFATKQAPLIFGPL